MGHSVSNFGDLERQDFSHSFCYLGLPNVVKSYWKTSTQLHVGCMWLKIPSLSHGFSVVNCVHVALQDVCSITDTSNTEVLEMVKVFMFFPHQFSKMKPKEHGSPNQSKPQKSFTSISSIQGHSGYALRKKIANRRKSMAIQRSNTKRENKKT